MASLKPGDRFREVPAQRFGRAGTEWVVEETFVGTDGLDYARVVSTFDPTARKTLSVAVLTDRRRFVSASRHAQ